MQGIIIELSMKGKDNRWDQSPEEETILKASSLSFWGADLLFTAKREKEVRRGSKTVKFHGSIILV